MWKSWREEQMWVLLLLFRFSFIYFLPLVVFSSSVGLASFVSVCLVWFVSGREEKMLSPPTSTIPATSIIIPFRAILLSVFFSCRRESRNEIVCGCMRLLVSLLLELCCIIKRMNLYTKIPRSKEKKTMTVFFSFSLLYNQPFFRPSSLVFLDQMARDKKTFSFFYSLPAGKNPFPNFSPFSSLCLFQHFTDLFHFLLLFIFMSEVLCVRGK